MPIFSWGRHFRFAHQTRPFEGLSTLEAIANLPGPGLAHGAGHSYGDSCLNRDNFLFLMSEWNRILSFDSQTGLLRAQSGTTLGTLVSEAARTGWNFPVVPSSGHVTLGGAVASDVHGRNHAVQGTIANHVRSVTLWRSSGGITVCSREKNASLFGATVGGLGLTGLILEVELKLERAKGNGVQTRTHCFDGIDRFFSFRSEALVRSEFQTAWLDLLSPRKKLRGVLVEANFARSEPAVYSKGSALISVPRLPVAAVRRPLCQLFNVLYFERQKRKRVERLSLPQFYFLLDKLPDWNRLYGRKGFFQLSFVIPERAIDRLPAVLESIRHSGLTAPLAILKSFGEVPSPGWLSFPQAGILGAIDFLNEGNRTKKAFRQWEAQILQLGGRIYPAKDSFLLPATFQAMYPRWKEVESWRDPKFSSSFWRRVTAV